MIWQTCATDRPTDGWTIKPHIICKVAISRENICKGCLKLFFFISLLVVSLFVFSAVKSAQLHHSTLSRRSWTKLHRKTLACAQEMQKPIPWCGLFPKLWQGKKPDCSLEKRICNYLFQVACRSHGTLGVFHAISTKESTIFTKNRLQLGVCHWSTAWTGGSWLYINT